jgi:uncharacterized OB-fold protein
VPDALSAPYWEAAAGQELALPRCGECKTLALPPEPVCPHCASTTPRWAYEQVSEAGVIRSWTVVRQSFLGEAVPFTLVDVELAGLRLIGRLIDGEPRVGAEARAAFADGVPGWVTP